MMWETAANLAGLLLMVIAFLLLMVGITDWANEVTGGKRLKIDPPEPVSASMVEVDADAYRQFITWAGVFNPKEAGSVDTNPPSFYHYIGHGFSDRTVLARRVPDYAGQLPAYYVDKQFLELFRMHDDAEQTTTTTES